jgi:hypothetical protein
MIRSFLQGYWASRVKALAGKLDWALLLAAALGERPEKAMVTFLCR